MLTAGHYGFHCDELLRLTLGNHLDRGYMQVPPLIGLLAKISTAVFGDAVFAARVFPVSASALMVWFTGLMVVEFGGQRWSACAWYLSNLPPDLGRCKRMAGIDKNLSREYAYGTGIIC